MESSPLSLASTPEATRILRARRRAVLTPDPIVSEFSRNPSYTGYISLESVTRASWRQRTTRTPRKPKRSFSLFTTTKRGSPRRGLARSTDRRGLSGEPQRSAGDLGGAKPLPAFARVDPPPSRPRTAMESHLRIPAAEIPRTYAWSRRHPFAPRRRRRSNELLPGGKEDITNRSAGTSILAGMGTAEVRAFPQRNVRLRRINGQGWRLRWILHRRLLRLRGLLDRRFLLGLLQRRLIRPAAFRRPSTTRQSTLARNAWMYWSRFVP